MFLTRETYLRKATIILKPDVAYTCNTRHSGDRLRRIQVQASLNKTLAQNKKEKSAGRIALW